MRTVIALSAWTALAFLAAGTSTAAEQQMKQLRVEGSRAIVETDKQTLTGINTKSVTLSYDVNVDDLDLKTAAGVTTAESRINAAAEAACKEISAKYPEAKPTDTDCVRSAVRRPLAKLHAAARAH